MKINFPEINQKDIDYALSCLEDCKQENAREFGFNYPYFTPGGGYGAQWWQLASTNLKQKHIELKNVEIQKGIYLDVIVDCGEISCFVSDENIKINFKSV